MTPTITAPVESEAPAVDQPEQCDAVTAVGERLCLQPAAVELIVAFPCGASQRRAACVVHGQWIERGYLFHAAHESDWDDRARVVAAVPLGGAA